MADIGLGQVRAGGEVERPLLTSGEELQSVAALLGDRDEYTAADVIAHLMSGVARAAGCRTAAARTGPG